MEQVDNILDVDISQLEIGETQTEILKSKEEIDDKTDVTELEIVRRSSRKKFLPLQTEKKRVISKPKRLPSDGTIDQNVINYYLDKKIKRSSSSLETIFEPKSDEPNSNHMSKRKFVRSLPAKEIPLLRTPKSKNKVKKRSMKVKINKPKKLTMDLLLKKLSSIEAV